MRKKLKNMAKNLTTLEEFDIRRRLQMPHLSYHPLTIDAKKNIAFLVLSNNNSEILMINIEGFRTSSVIAGLSEKHIEYIAKNTPEDYKKIFIEIINNKAEVEDIIEIAKAMDEDLGGNVTKNQERVKNVIQYIKDNKIAFEF